MKKALKIFFISASLAVMTILLSLSAYAADGIKVLTVKDGSKPAAEQYAIDWYKSPVDNTYYLFLPSGVKSDNLVLSFNSNAPVMCDGVQLKNGETTSVFAGGNKITLTSAGCSYTVAAIESDGIATAYINTQSGSLSAIHADKEHKEPGTAVFIDKDGKEQYNGNLDYIKGRGNSTWLADKKPYNIKLESKSNLFGMGKSKKWCLLANSSDDSHIKNSLSYDFAQQLGVDVTSDTYPLNLYINGNYEGVYVITEKVEIGSNRVDIYDLEGATEDANSAELDSYKLAGAQNSREWGSIKYAEIPNDPDEITGGYLLELEKIYRYVNEASGFVTNIGQAVVVKTPEFATKNQVEYISSYYQEFEDALYSSTGYNSQGKHYSEYIDMESLAEMYITDEFTTNFDGCSSSFYLYKDVDGKLIAGPAWDFDLAFGIWASNDLINHVTNLADPNLLYIQTCFIGNHNENKNALLAQAFSHKDFQELVEKIWNEKVKAYNDTFRSNIDSFGGAVKSSAVMNAVRWNLYGTTDRNTILGNYDNRINAIKSHTAARYDFLSKAYSADTYFLKYDIGAYGIGLINDTTIYNNGDTATVKDAPKSSDELMLFNGWSTEPDGSGAVYQPGDVITMDEETNLYAQWKKDTSFSGRIKALQRAIREFFAKIAEFFKKIGL